MNRTVRRRIISLIAVLAMFFVMLLSVKYVCEHANHDCEGTDCDICFVLEQCSTIIKKIGTAFCLTSMAGLILLNKYDNRITALCSLIYGVCTPVSLKIQMNN